MKLAHPKTEIEVTEIEIMALSDRMTVTIDNGVPEDFKQKGERYGTGKEW
jgi:hypothetical protein